MSVPSALTKTIRRRRNRHTNTIHPLHTHMSVYSRLEGCIKYQTKIDLQNALDILVDGNWMDENHIWLTETHDKKYSQPNPTVSHETNTLRIPNDHYRNLSRKESDLLTNAEFGTIIGSSQDGEFVGWVATEQDNWTVNLRTWARTQGHSIVDERNQQEYVNFQNTIMNEWHDAHSDYPRA